MSSDKPATMAAFGAPQIWVERPHRFTLYVGPHNPKQVPIEFVAANEADIRQAAERIGIQQQAPQEPSDVVSKFLPPDTPPTLRQDVLGALEALLEAARTFSAQSGRRDANELMEVAIRAGGLVRSAHGAKVEECLCHETTYGRHCPIHGKHWAVREAESWEPEHGMKLVSYERETEGTLLRVDPVPGSSIIWHVLVNTDPPIVYQFSSDDSLKLGWSPKAAPEKVSD